MVSFIHGNDLSFQNFILVENGTRAVIIDFSSAEPENTRMNGIVGTPKKTRKIIS